MRISSQIAIFFTLILSTPFFLKAQTKAKKAEHEIVLLSDYFSPNFTKNDVKLFEENLCLKDSATVILFGIDIMDIADSLALEKKKVLEKKFTKIIVIPSEKDWQNYKQNGQLNLQFQKLKVDSLFEENIILAPQDGCPGPQEIILTEDITLIIIDPVSINNPWNYDENGDYKLQSCNMEDDAEFYLNLSDAIKRNSGKATILASYLPVYSYGNHGGKFSGKSHLFPIKKANSHFYFPLPIIGSTYVIYRKAIGNIDDFSSYNYSRFRNAIKEVIKNKKIIYCSALENNFQFFTNKDVIHLSIGSLAEEGYVKKASSPNFSCKAKGYTYLHCSSGNILLELRNLHDDKLFSKIIKANSTSIEPCNKFQGEEQTDSINHIPSSQYKASSFKKFWFGKNYRESWSTEVTFPILKLSEEYGDLKIVKRGGGQQTRSARLEAPDGRQLVIRSIEKYPEKALPDELKNTFAASLVQDQISASFPYAAPIVACLADAAGVLHTNPKLVFLTENNNFGIYKEEIANDLYLYEERPDELWGNYESFGNPDKISGTLKILEKIYKNNDNRVDQLSVLKARLFDVWINDWDRHDDQWRWAGFKTGNGWLYKPIPRDRDQAFFLNEGVIPWIASRKWALRKIQGFRENTKDIPGLIYNARYFDRTFLNEPQLEEWIQVADSLKINLSDSIIISSVKNNLPESIYNIDGERIANILIKRRDRLNDFANRFYNFISKKVDIVGSAKNEYFEVKRIDDDNTSVCVSRLNKDGSTEKAFYSRNFKTNQTKEIVLYGLQGSDIFKLEGNVSKGPKIRIIGGSNTDTLIDNSHCKSLTSKLLYYDLKNDQVIESKNNCKLKLQNYPDINAYNRMAFKYNIVKPLVDFSFNKDDGLSYAIGVGLVNHGFRKEPFSSNQRFLAQISSRSKAYQFHYNGEFTSVLRKTNLLLNAKGEFPNYTQNFFGFGNETKIIHGELDYYKVRWESISFEAALQKNVFDKAKASMGTFIELIDIEEREDNFFLANHPEFVNDSAIFEDFHYTGSIFRFSYDSRDNKHLPKQGLFFNLNHKFFKGFHENFDSHHTFSGDFSFYKNFKNSDRLVLAARCGGSMAIGKQKLFHYNFLGGRSNLRGYRNQRFYGDRTLYQNTELRLRLFNFSSYLIKGKSGLLLFNDLGRVWFEKENSKIWHHGYGSGIWIAPFAKTVITVNFEKSIENNLITFKLKYFY